LMVHREEEVRRMQESAMEERSLAQAAQSAFRPNKV